MEDVVSLAIVTVTVIVLAVIGVVHLTGDFRQFNAVVDTCKSRGYVQSENFRVYCQVETK
jgi:hypothetical protein